MPPPIASENVEKWYFAEWNQNHSDNVVINTTLQLDFESSNVGSQFQSPQRTIDSFRIQSRRQHYLRIWVERTKRNWYLSFGEPPRNFLLTAIDQMLILKCWQLSALSDFPRDILQSSNDNGIKISINQLTLENWIKLTQKVFQESNSILNIITIWYRQKSHVTNSQRLKIVKKMKQKSLAHVSVVWKNSENLQLFPRIPKRFSFSTFEILFKLTESRILFTQLQFYILSCFLAFLLFWHIYKNRVTARQHSRERI